MTAPSKAAMDAARDIVCGKRVQTMETIATAFDAFAAAQSAELLEALEEACSVLGSIPAPHDYNLWSRMCDAISRGRAAILAAKGGQS